MTSVRPPAVLILFKTPRSEQLRQAGLRQDEIRWLELKDRDPDAAAAFMRTYRSRNDSTPTGGSKSEATLIRPSASEENHPEDRDQPRIDSEPVVVEDRSCRQNQADRMLRPHLQTADSETGDAIAADQSKRAPRTDHLQTRVRVVAEGGNAPASESQEMTELRTSVDRAGIAKAKEFEEKAGRVVEELPHNHPGYDLHSRERGSDEIARHIEVKSTGADWNGVLLSSTQFEEAQRLGDRYWLYVVENADSPDARVCPIQNPAGLAEKFIFDNGWKDVAQVLSPPTDPG